MAHDDRRPPVLAALDVLHAAFDVLSLALAERHPPLEQPLLPLAEADMQLRRAQPLLGLADVLRAIAADYRDALRRDASR